jgi:hypothetical protein
MTKNFTIGVLLVLTVMLAVRVDPECANTDDPNTVVIEYECATIDDYENVPPEVIEECRQRNEERIRHSKNRT